MILNQTLSTQITRQLAAIRYAQGHGLHRRLSRRPRGDTRDNHVDDQLRPGGGAFDRHLLDVSRATLLPIEMTAARMLAVLAIAWGMSALSALAAVGSCAAPIRWSCSDHGCGRLNARRGSVASGSACALFCRWLVAARRFRWRGATCWPTSAAAALDQRDRVCGAADAAAARIPRRVSRQRVGVIRNIDGDIFLTSATKFSFAGKDPFSRRQLYAARAVDGVELARPIYAEWTNSSWKNPQTRKTYTAEVLAFDPDQPVFLFPEVGKHLEALRQPTRPSSTGSASLPRLRACGTVTELSRREIRIIGTFALGPDFTTDGIVITSDRTFLKFFAPHRLAAGELADVEFGVIKVRPGYSVELSSAR